MLICYGPFGSKWTSFYAMTVEKNLLLRAAAINWKERIAFYLLCGQNRYSLASCEFPVLDTVPRTEIWYRLPYE